MNEKCPLTAKEDISTDEVKNEPLQHVLNRGQKRGFTFWQNRKLSKRLRKKEKDTRSLSPAKHCRALRNLVLFHLALDSALRGGDLMGLYAHQLFYSNGAVKKEFSTIQQKTGKEVTCKLGRKTRTLLKRWQELENLQSTDFLFRGCGTESHFSVRQYRRIVKCWAESIHLPKEEYSTHSMRRTAAHLNYKKFKDFELVRVLLGHTSISSTQYYLRMELSKALSMIRKVRLY